MKTKRDFQAAIAAEISNYPTAAQLYRARDPSLLAQLDAMSAMLAMASAEQDVAAAEPFTKARDMTVLADASAKGVLPFGLSARVTLQVTNGNPSPFVLATGRRLLDTQGRGYAVVAGVTIPANGTVGVTAVQHESRQFDHTVTITQPFYQVEVPAAAPGKSIASVRVVGADGNEFAYTPEYVNVVDGAKVFHLQSDENQRLLVEFGADGLAGYQPQAGEVFTIIITDTDGDVSLSAGSRFAFEYTALLADNQVVLAMDSVVSAGRATLPVPVLRKISNYPSIYDTSAVYLGNFDFLVRRKLSPFRFLSVWNEQTEEAVRGADVDNINSLFVAAKKDGVDDAEVFEQVKALILAADDSYRVKSVPVVEEAIPVSITARVHSVYDFEEVHSQIREKILLTYGRDSDFSKSGQSRVLYRSIYALLTGSVVALQGGRADLVVTVDDLASLVPPEKYRYVSEASLTIEVDQA